MFTWEVAGEVVQQRHHLYRRELSPWLKPVWLQRNAHGCINTMQSHLNAAADERHDVAVHDQRCVQRRSHAAKIACTGAAV